MHEMAACLFQNSPRDRTRKSTLTTYKFLQVVLQRGLVCTVDEFHQPGALLCSEQTCRDPCQMLCNVPLPLITHVVTVLISVHVHGNQ